MFQLGQHEEVRDDALHAGSLVTYHLCPAVAFFAYLRSVEQLGIPLSDLHGSAEFVGHVRDKVLFEELHLFEGGDVVDHDDDTVGIPDPEPLSPSSEDHLFFFFQHRKLLEKSVAFLEAFLYDPDDRGRFEKEDPRRGGCPGELEEPVCRRVRGKSSFGARMAMIASLLRRRWFGALRELRDSRDRAFRF